MSESFFELDYDFAVRDCPICGRHLPIYQYNRHILTHSCLTEAEKQSIRASVRSHYSWADFQWEQHEDF